MDFIILCSITNKKKYIFKNFKNKKKEKKKHISFILLSCYIIINILLLWNENIWIFNKNNIMKDNLTKVLYFQKVQICDVASCT